MQYEFYISEEELKDSFKRYSNKFLQIGFIERIKRIRKEIISLADLSKIIVDRKVENVVIYGRKLEYLCRALSKQYHVFTIRVNGIKSKEYYFNSRFSRLCSYDEYFWDTLEAFCDEDNVRIEKIKKKMIRYLRGASPKVLLTISFSPPRLLDTILYDAAKECNIPVVLLEHGFLNNATANFEAGMKKHLLLGKRCIDFYWCWNQKNRDIYIKNKLTSEEKSFVLGYPLKPYERVEGKGELSVLFVGDWLLPDDVEANIRFYTVVNEIYQICCKLGIPFRYKGHPSEKQDKKSKYVKEYLFPDINCVDDLFGEFRKNRIVVGCCTSALMEAGYVGNYVIQIDYDHERVKDFIFEHCYLIEDYHREFEPLIQAIKNQEIFPKPLSSYEFYQPEDILAEFNKGLEKVECYYTGSERDRS